jgi:hypothetical protein
MSDDAPKPWETGFDVDLLPRTEPIRRPKGTGRAINAAKRLENFKGRAMKDLTPSEKKAAKEKEWATKEAKRKARQLGKRGKGTMKEMKSAEAMMRKHNFDPMDLLLNVAAGKALYDDHPFLPVLHRYLNDAVDRIDNDDGFGVRGLLAQIKTESYGYLQDSYTPKEHRINVAKELMQYVRPKKKQIEHTGSGQSGPVVVMPLTEEEVGLFKVWFDQEF